MIYLYISWFLCHWYITIIFLCDVIWRLLGVYWGYVFTGFGMVASHVIWLFICKLPTCFIVYTRECCLVNIYTMTCVSRFVRILQVHKSFDFYFSLDYISTNLQLNQIDKNLDNFSCRSRNTRHQCSYQNFYMKGSWAPLT